MSIQLPSWGAAAARLRRGLVVLACLLAPLTSVWAQHPGFEIGAVPAWVQPLAADLAATVPPQQVAQGVHYLLADHQLRVDGQDRVSYRHVAMKALNERGVQSIANIEIRFDPSYQRLILHSINVRRGMQLIHKLTPAAVRLLQREKELDALIFDGSKTAHVFLDDVRVGDVVEYAYSLRGGNPVFGGRHFGRFDMQWNAPVARVHARLLWPQGRALFMQRYNDAPAPTVTELGSHREHRWDLRGVGARLVETDAPGWFDPYPAVQWSEFKDWQAVVRWAQPLYRLPDALGPRARAEVSRIAAAHADPGERLLATLRFVQREVRYLGVEIGASSHAPNPPELVLQRRFGDCKDKSLLTVTMLRALGLEAQPALVNTVSRQGIERWQPSPGAFDHVLVRARVGRNELWLDPTQAPQQGTLTKVAQADHGLALVIDDSTQGLTPMAGDMARMQWREVHAVLDASAGFDAPVGYTVKTVVEGAAADALRAQLAAQSRDALEKSYLNYYAARYPGVEAAGPLEVADDAAANQFTLTEFYRIRDFWQRSETHKRLEATILAPELQDYLRQPSSLARESPLALNHPVDLVHVTEVRLPANWQLKPDRLKVDDPAFEFQRTEFWAGRTLTLQDRFRSRRDHVAAADIGRYAAKLEQARRGVNYTLYYNDAAASADAVRSGDGPHWLAAVLGTLAVLGSIVLALRIHRWDPAPAAPSPLRAGPPPPRGLGGWLLLVAVGLIASCVQVVQGMVELWPALGATSWAALTTPGQASYHLLWAPSMLFALLANIGLLAGLVLTMVLFVQRRSSLPTVYIGVMSAAVLAGIIDAALTSAIPAASQGITASAWAEQFRGVVGVTIWITYMLRSQRVRCTFVERRPPPPVKGDQLLAQHPAP